MQLLERFIEMLESGMKASPHTVASYRYDLLNFLEYIKDPVAADREAIQVYLNNLQTQQLDPATIARRMSCMRHFYRFLCEEKICTQNPMARLAMPRQRRQVPHVLDESNIQELLEYIHADNSANSIRLRAILELLYGCGLRVSELVCLPFNALEYDEGKPWLFVRGKGQRERLLPINDTAQKTLEDYLKIRKGYIKTTQQGKWLFPSSSKAGHLTRQRINQLLRETAIACGIDPNKISPHGLRHAFATHLLQRGADLLVIQHLLGHARIQTTEIYTHIMPKQVENLVHEHHPLSHAEIED